jgi:hypothetical protein
VALPYARVWKKKEKDMKRSKQGKADVLLLGGILLVGCVLGLLLLLTQHSGTNVQVRVDGVVIATYPLRENRTYEIAGVDGGTNLLVIQNGEAWVEEASCPDGLCKSMGRISQNGQSVICLPNKVVVEILSDTEENDSGVDMIAG